MPRKCIYLIGLCKKKEKNQVVPYNTPSAHTPPRYATSADISAGIPQWKKGSQRKKVEDLDPEVSKKNL
jgi:hypothetical protein